MTLIAIACRGDHADIVTDSFTCTAFGRLTGNMAKVATLPHIDAALTVQGDYRLQASIAYEANAQLAVVDLDALVTWATGALPDIWAHRWADDPAEPYDSTCYVVGYSPARDRFEAFAFPAADDFRPVDLTAGTFMFPEPYSDPGPAPASDDDWAELVGRIHAERSLDIGGTGRKVPTGGRVTLTRIERGLMTQRALLAFPSHGPMFHRLMEGFNHPSAQLAPCACGSGLTYARCHLLELAAEPCECGSGSAFGECCAVDPLIEPSDPCPCLSGSTVGACCAPHLSAA